MDLAVAPSGMVRAKVWDLGVRTFHWLLVAAFAVCAYTGFLGPPNLLNLHLAGGATIALLIVFRIAWGFLGSAYARFASFPVTVPIIRNHLRDLFAKRPERHAGHNPLGALMIYALLGVLAVECGLGLIALGGFLKQGPLAFVTSFSAGRSAREVHELLALGLLAMVGGHLAGVAFESWRVGDNIALSMVTGRKDLDHAPSYGGGRVRPVLTALVTAAIGVAGTFGIATLARLPGLGVPSGPVDVAYSAECGSCHLAYPPQLVPASRWRGIMAGLDDHFGENASLPPATAAHIEAWLVSNAAETADTRAAHAFVDAAPGDPLRITATPGWKRIHRHLPDAIFKAKGIGAPGACGACHSDAASGRFDPQAISVPKEHRP